MAIESLLRLVESFLNSRSGMLWTLEDRAFSHSELKAALGLQPDVLFRRRRTPATWRPSELGQLAHVLHVSSDPVVSLANLAPGLEGLPHGIRGPLLKEGRLDQVKLRVRLLNVDAWQYGELEHLASTLRRWQDTKRIQNLLATVK